MLPSVSPFSQEAASISYVHPSGLTETQRRSNVHTPPCPMPALRIQRPALVLVVAIAAVAVHLHAQAPAPRPVFRGRYDLVQVDVSVLDKKRHPVRGLTAEDFSIFDDGQPRQIQAFTEVYLPGRVRAQDARGTSRCRGTS